MHQESEARWRAYGQAQFQLSQRLQQARVSHPEDSSIGTDASEELMPTPDDDFDLELDHELDENGRPLRGKENIDQGNSPNPEKKRATRIQFGRRRTHNEEIAVAPCSMIMARETFYGAEAIPSVVVCLALDL
jgi:hypothetical protein